MKKRRTVAAGSGGSTAVRRLLNEFSVARQRVADAGGEQLLAEAVAGAVAGGGRHGGSKGTLSS